MRKFRGVGIPGSDCRKIAEHAVDAHCVDGLVFGNWIATAKRHLKFRFVTERIGMNEQVFSMRARDGI